jgi:hypothetical protein
MVFAIEKIAVPAIFISSAVPNHPKLAVNRAGRTA